jgi:phytoene synthase
MASDLGPVRIESFADLYRYAFRAAGTVGLAMAHVLGATTPIALRCAANLGVAMQLTNILRDVGADLRRDRVYLPADELAMFGLSATRLFELWERRRAPDPLFDAMLRFQITRARAYYQRGLAGVRYLPPEARPAILVAGRLYRAILDRIACDGAVVLHRRAATSGWHKIREAAGCMLALRLGHLPAGGAEEWRGSPELGWLRLSADDERLLVPVGRAARPA